MLRQTSCEKSTVDVIWLEFKSPWTFTPSVPPSEGDKRGEPGQRQRGKNRNGLKRSDLTQVIEFTLGVVHQARAELTFDRKASYLRREGRRKLSGRAGLRYWFLERIYERCSREPLPTDSKKYGAILEASWSSCGWRISTLLNISFLVALGLKTVPMM